MELYKKYRPETFGDVVGNEKALAVLTSKIEKKSVPHTILFSGSSGCGKTTIARILAREIGCSDFDYVEMNCSNYRGVDMVRDIDQKARLSPASGKVKVYVWDECQSLTADAQSAALKLLEDTPEHCYFFLCTTHPEKLKEAIKTRCFNVKVDLLSDAEMKRLICRVVKAEKKSITKEAVSGLVTGAMGSPRRGLVGLDRIIDLSEKEQASAAETAAEEQSAIKDLSYALFKRKGWTEVSKILQSLKNEEPEAIRNAVMGMASACLLGGGWGNDMGQVACVLEQFSEPFFDSRFNGVVLASFNCIEE